MRKFMTACALASLVVACGTKTKEFPSPTLAIPQTGWQYSLEYSDEFDGEKLDRTKWHDTNPNWLGRKPALFMAKNVRLEDGMLILSSHREEPTNPPSDEYHTFTSAAVQSVDTLHYGFYEIRSKASNSAISSAFWLYVNDSTMQEEIDIFEICGRHDTDSMYEHSYFATAHYLFHADTVHEKRTRTHITDFKLAERFIVAGLEWNENEIIWYVDGVEVHRCKNEYWKLPETVNFDCETFPTWWGLPSDTDNGGEFKIEYFRYWTKG